MKKITKKYIIILSLLIVLSILAVIGVTYASIIKKETQTESNVISTLSCLDISIINEENSLSLQNAYPIKDSTGEKQTPYSFTIKNNCDRSMEIYLLFEVSNTSTLSEQYLKVKLDENTPTLLSSYEGTTPISGRNSYILKKESLIQNGQINHEFNIWLDYDTTKEQANSKTLSGKIIVKSVAKASNEIYALDSLVRDNNNINNIETIPGKQMSSLEENRIATSSDGTRLVEYFRGNVKNNYVLFANMCWRIVRKVDLNGTKLVLFNSNESNVDNPCDSVYNSPNAAFAKYSGNTYLSKFNTSYNQNAYIGFMYGTPGSTTYAAEHANNTKSTILTNLESWYTNVLSQKEDFDVNILNDDIWCNDKSTFTTYEDGTIAAESLGYGSSDTKYSTDKRLYGSNTSQYANPSLICSNDNNGGNLSKYTVSSTSSGNGALTYPIGLLTADEVAFAGSIYDSTSQNTSYYLYENATASNWWTLSPNGFSDSKASMLGVSTSGSIITITEDNNAAIRPAIIIKSFSPAIGTGTSKNPYYIIPGLDLEEEGVIIGGGD